jgi:hypothetical protein
MDEGWDGTARLNGRAFEDEIGVGFGNGFTHIDILCNIQSENAFDKFLHRTHGPHFSQSPSLPSRFSSD